MSYSLTRLSSPRFLGGHSRAALSVFALIASALLGTAAAIGGRALQIGVLGVGVFATPMLLRCRGFVLVEAALIALFLSRVSVGVGGPPALNFVHFPVVLFAAAVASLRPDRSPRRVASKLAIGAVLLFTVAVLSAIANGRGLASAIAVWMVFVEPFLLLYAVLRDPPAPAQLRFFVRLLIALALLQAPFAIWQALTRGAGDPVQGTFVGQGAGAHVLGVVSLVAVTFLLATKAVSVQWRALALAGLMLTLPLLADAKQALVLFVGAYAITTLLRSPRHWIISAIGTAVLVSIVVTAVKFLPGWGLLANWPLIVDGLTHKLSIATLTSARYDNWLDWLLGIGPGNTVSRIAMMSLRDYAGGSSLLAGAGVDASPITARLYATDVASYLARSGTGSSAWSFIFSWAGLWGDLGIAGLTAYLWLAVSVWRSYRPSSARRVNPVRVTILLLGMIAAVYSYLEEPAVTLWAAAWIAYALLADTGRPTSPATIAADQRATTSSTVGAGA